MSARFVLSALTFVCLHGCLLAGPIVFTCPQSWSVGMQMLPLMTELQKRGHEVLLWANPRFADVAKEADVPFKSHPEHLWPIGHLQSAVSEMVNASSLGADPWAWLRVGRTLGSTLGQLGHQDYTQYFTAFDADMEANPPSLVIGDFFSGPMMDWATSRNVPWIFFYTVNLGHVAGFQDSWASPDPIHGDTVEAHHGSFLRRLRKLAAFFNVLAHIIPHAPKIDAARIRHGVQPYASPTIHFNKHHTIVTNPSMWEVPRMLSPLVHMVGFMVTPFDSLRPMDQWDPQDVEWWNWVEEAEHNTPGGVIYISFGTEVYPSPRLLTAIIQGASDYAIAADMTVLLALRPEAQAALPAGYLPATRCPRAANALPKRVTLVPWVRQAAVLMHPATKLFITHAGQASIVEAIYSHTPILAIPGFTDQSHNAYRVAALGLGLYLDPANITASAVNETLAELDTEPSYSEALAHFDAYARRGPSPASRAADVVEEELLFRSSSVLVPVEHLAPVWMAAGVDVLGFVLLVLLLVLWVVWRVVKAVVCGLCGGRRKIKAEVKVKPE